MSAEQASDGYAKRREPLLTSCRAAIPMACALLMAGCGLGSAKFGDPVIPNPPPPPAGGASR